MHRDQNPLEMFHFSFHFFNLSNFKMTPQKNECNEVPSSKAAQFNSCYPNSIGCC